MQLPMPSPIQNIHSPTASITPLTMVFHTPLSTQPINSLSLLFLSSTRHMTSQTSASAQITTGRYYFPVMYAARVVPAVQGDEQMGSRQKTYTMQTMCRELRQAYPEAWAGSTAMSRSRVMGCGGAPGSSSSDDYCSMGWLRAGLDLGLRSHDFHMASTRSSMNCVLSLVICNVKNTIKYQNSILPTVSVNITPYYMPRMKNGTCKKIYSVYLTQRQATYSPVLIMNTKIGKMQQNACWLLSRPNCAYTAGTTTYPHTTTTTTTIMKSSLFL